MADRYKFETNEKGERIMTDTKTGKVMRVEDVIGDQSKGDATAMACAAAGGGDPRKRHGNRRNRRSLKEESEMKKKQVPIAERWAQDTGIRFYDDDGNEEVVERGNPTAKSLGKAQKPPIDGRNGVDRWSCNGYGLTLNGIEVKPPEEENDPEPKEEE